jgi:hypothetical protein
VKTLRLFFAGLAFSLLATPAKAGLLIDPYLGYEAFGTVAVANSPIRLNYSGTGFGFRMGYTLFLVSFSADFRMVRGSLTNQNGGTDAFEETQIGAVVGAAFPFIRAYLGYSPINKLMFGSSSTSYSGSSTKFGIGFSGLPFVVFNAEYVMNNYNAVKSNLLPQSSLAASGSAFVLSVSWPFDI